MTRQITRVRQRLDGAVGDRSVAWVQVQRGEGSLFQVVRDRPRVSFGAARIRQPVRQTQVEALSLPLGQALVRHVAQHLAPEAPRILPIAFGDQELGVLQLGHDVFARLGDQRELGRVERAAREQRRLADQVARGG